MTPLTKHVILASLTVFGLASAAIAGGTAHWDPYTPIEATYHQSAEYVGVGKQITLSVSDLSDVDAWIVNGVVDHTATDTLTTQWTITNPDPGGIAATHTGSSWTWTVPESVVGTFTVNVTVDDNRSVVDLRNDYPWTWSSTFTVCRVTELVSDGVGELYKTNHYINLKALTGNVVVSAHLEPEWLNETPYVLPEGFVMWTGGTVTDPPNQVRRWVSLTAASDSVVKAKVGTIDEKEATVHVVDGGEAFVGQPALAKSRAGNMDCPDPFGISSASTGIAGNPLVLYQVNLPEGANAWHFSVGAITHSYRTGFNAGTNPERHDVVEPASDLWLAWNWTLAVPDLTPQATYDANAVLLMVPPRTIAWCSDITWDHEEYHMGDLHDNNWVHWMIDGAIPYIEAHDRYFDCALGITTAAAARAWQDARIQAAAAAATDDACSEFGADMFREQRAYQYNVPEYLDRCYWITQYWP